MPTELQLANVSVSAGGSELLHDISLRLAEGDFIALVGPNGAGKTTLIRAALGLLPTTGSALLGGQPLRALSGRKRAALAGWLPQQAQITEPLTALDFVAGARYRFDETRSSAEAGAVDALRRTGAEHFARRAVTTLSGGEQQRVALAALLAQEAPLLLLDEPGNHLDPGQQIALYSLIGDLWSDGRGILCITHDVNLLARVGDPNRLRVAGLAGGRIQFDVPYASHELQQRLESLFGIVFDVVEAGGRRAFLPGGRNGPV